MEALTDGNIVGTALRNVFVVTGMVQEIDVSANMQSEVHSVVIEGTPTILNQGSSQYNAFARNIGGQTLFTGAGFHWTSSDPTVLYVDSDTGLASPLDLGESTLSATLIGTNKSGTFDVTVISANGESIDVSPPTAELLIGGELQFTANVQGLIDNSVTWSVDEVDGGTVTEDGLYMAPMSPGVFHVRATSVANPSLTDFALVSVVSQSNWTVILLHPFGARESRAIATDGAQQVGQTTHGSVSDYHACIWTGSAASFVDINPGGYRSSSANAVANGRQYGNVHLSSGPDHAGYWTGTASSFINLKPSSVPVAFIEDSDGVQQGGATGGANPHAALWEHSAGSWVDLHPAGATQSYVDGVHNGIQTGRAFINNQWHAGYWTGTAGSWVDLHPAGSVLSWARAVHDGLIVGSSQFASTNALLWTGSAESYINLHPAGASQSVASGIRGGQQVGWATFNGDNHAALWSGTAASFVDLHAFLPSRFSESLARGICHVGSNTFIVGEAKDSATGRNEAVMWKRGF
jgi:hypothetical protein